MGILQEDGMRQVAAIAGWRQALRSCFMDLKIHITRQLCDCHGRPHDPWRVTDIAACHGIKCWHNAHIVLRLV